MLNTPVIAETLLKQYYSPSADGAMSQSTKDALVYLLSKGLIDRSDLAARVTSKGVFFVKHILSIPFPIETYTIPDTK